MDVATFNALKTYDTAQKTLASEKTGAMTGEPKTSDFKVADPVSEMASAVMKSESAASAYMTGKADPHSVVEAMASAELAVETAVTLRNRVVEAYQELLRMPV